MDKGRPTFDLARRRLERGLTQQELAERSGLTSRTVQRIEKGEVVPYGDSIRKLAHALDLTPEELYNVQTASGTPDAGQFKILCYFHFLPLLGIIFPFANILAPLFLWINYRDISTSYDTHGRISLNFQLTITIVLMISIALLVAYFPLGFPLFVLTYLYTIGSCIYNGIRAQPQQLPQYYFYISFLRLPSPTN